MKLKAWVQAARPRTLPLSISGILVGTAMAIYQDPNVWNTKIFVLAIATTIGFQVISNFANDYGDGIKGTDNEERIGPKRAMQSGLLNARELQWGIIVSVVLSFISMLFLLFLAFGSERLPFLLLFIFLGITAIIAAIKYTVGNKAYGYSGKGDVFVFLFFGLLAVIGTYWLYNVTFDATVIFPAIGIGCLSTAVLNLNNMRDYLSDKNVGKNTLVVKIGLDRAKKYHLSLLLIALICFLIYLNLHWESWTNSLFLIGFLPLAVHFNIVIRNKNTGTLDPELKKVALSTFLISLLFLIGYHNFL